MGNVLCAAPSVSRGRDGVKVDRLAVTLERAVRWTRLSVRALTRLINTPNRAGRRDVRSVRLENRYRSANPAFASHGIIEFHAARERVLSMTFRCRAARFICSCVGLKFPRSARTPTWCMCRTAIPAIASLRACRVASTCAPFLQTLVKARGFVPVSLEIIGEPWVQKTRQI